MRFLLLPFIILLFTACNETNTDGIPPQSEKETKIAEPILRMAQTAAGVSINTQLVFNFVQEMNTSTFVSGNIIFEDSSQNSVAYDISETNSSLTLTPTSLLNANTHYVVTLKSTLQYSDGNFLDQDYEYKFTTNSGIVDTTPPSLLAQSPRGNATEIPIHTAFSFEFDEIIDDANMSVKLDGAPLALTTNQDTVLARHDAPLAFDTDYTVELAGVKDLAGNLLGTLSYQFRTTSNPSAGPELNISDAQGIIDIAGNTIVAFTFDGGSNNNVVNFQRQGSDFNLTATYSTNYPEPVENAFFYDSSLFSTSRNELYNYRQGGYSYHMADKNISFFTADADIACITYNGSDVDIFAFYPLGGYHFYDPIDFDNNYSAKTCHVTQDGYVVFADNVAGLRLYDISSDYNASEFATIPETNVSSIASHNTLLFYAQDKTIKVHDKNGTALGSVTLAQSIKTLKFYANKLFALSTTGNSIYVIDARNPNDLHSFYTITPSQDAVSFDFDGDFLVAGYQTSGFNKAIEYFDISSLGVTTVDTAQLGTATKAYKVRSNPYHYSDYVITVGDTIHFLGRGSEFEYTSLVSPAINFKIYHDQESNTSHIVLAKAEQGVEILKIVEDGNGSISSLVSEANITSIGKVFSVLAGELEHNGTAYPDKLFVGTDTQLIRYDISNPTLPQHERNDTSFGAISDITGGLDPLTSQVHVYIAEYANRRIREMTFSHPDDHTISDTFNLEASPRSVHFDTNRSLVLAALGAGGVVAIETNSSTLVYKSTAGFAMDVDSWNEIDENNDSYLKVAVADYTGTSLYNVELGPLSSASFYPVHFLPVVGAPVYSSAFYKNRDSSANILISVQNDGYGVRQGGFGYVPHASERVTSDNPVSILEFFDNPATQSKPLDGIIDPL